MEFLRIKPVTLALLTPCSTSWVTESITIQRATGHLDPLAFIFCRLLFVKAAFSFYKNRFSFIQLYHLNVLYFWMSPFNRSFLWSHQRNVIAVTASHWNSVFLCLVQSFIINSIIFLIQIVSGSNLGYYWDSELLRIPLEIAHLGERICRLWEFYVHPL